MGQVTRILLVALTIAATAALADDRPSPVKIGILTDMSGVFSANTGEGSVVAAQMAVEDFGGEVLGRSIILVSADHQNKPDIGSTRAREWFDRDGVDVVADLVNSSVALAVMKVAAEKNKITIVLGSGSTRISNEDCTATNAQWTYDTYATGNTLAKALVGAGRDTWFFVTADYAFGRSTEQDVTAIVRTAGGTVLGSVKYPVGASDYASSLLEAQASGAKVVVLANAGADTVNAVKQAAEFGMIGKQTFVGPAMVINDVHGIGLKAGQGMYLTEGFYWDKDAASRAFARRFYDRLKKMPNMANAAAYSSITHYLKAVQAVGSKDAAKVMARMREEPIIDALTSNGKLRPDGLMVHDMYLLQVKSPEQSTQPWDYLTIKQTIRGDQAFAPPSASRCPLVAKN